MRIGFTKMHGAGNDFVVLDETVQRLHLTAGQYRWLADRHIGIGADQILSVRPASTPDVDFDYAIHNADGGQVEHCGNGARCFVRFARERGLTTKDVLRVRVQHGVITLRMQADGRVMVDMGAPVFDLPRIPFEPAAAPEPLHPIAAGNWSIWPLVVMAASSRAITNAAVLSMGNPHAVTWVDDVDHAPVAVQGPQIGQHPAFVQGVNVGFVQIVDRTRLRLRVFERGAGETLSCGTGACAAVVAGIRLGLLSNVVNVTTRGGELTIRWSGQPDDPVCMTGPAETVFEGTVDVPAL